MQNKNDYNKICCCGRNLYTSNKTIIKVKLKLACSGRGKQVTLQILTLSSSETLKGIVRHFGRCAFLLGVRGEDRHHSHICL